MKNSLCFIILLFSFLMFSGCFSVIGYGVGTAIDNSRSGEHFTIKEELFDISPETEIELVTISNDTISGFYRNSTNEYSNAYIGEYQSKYEEINSQMPVPNIGDTLFIANPIGEIYKYIFLGFDYKKIYVKSVLSNHERFMTLLPDQNIKLQNDQYLDFTFINDGIEFKLIPIMSKLNLQIKSGNISVFYHNIHRIQTTSKKTTGYLLLVGIAIDLYLYLNDYRLLNINH